jgi:excisionase family DNA binding protein
MSWDLALREIAMGENGLLHEVLTLEEAARFLKLTTKEVRALARQDRIPGQMIGCKWRFLKAALVAWLGNANSSSSAWEQFGAFADDPTMPELRRLIEENRRRLNVEVYESSEA